MEEQHLVQASTASYLGGRIVTLEKNSELLDFSFFRYLEYKYSRYVIQLAKLLLCIQDQNFWLLHFVVVYKPHVQQECLWISLKVLKNSSTGYTITLIKNIMKKTQDFKYCCWVILALGSALGHQ